MKVRGVALVGLIFVCVVVSFALCACQQGTPPPATEEEKATKPAGAKPTSPPPTQLPLTVGPEETFKQGDKVSICGVAFAVAKVERLKGAGSGNSDLLVVTVSITNDSDKEVPIIPFDFYMSNVEGKVTDLAYGSADNALEGGPLGKGETVSGTLAFDAKPDTRNLSVVWLPGWCAEKAVVQLE